MFSDRVRARLEDIAQDVARAQLFVGEMDVHAFVADEQTMFAIERLLQRITEAVIQIGPDTMGELAPDAPVKQIRDFGNLLRHQYADIDPGVILTIVREDLPPLAAAALRALERP